MLSDIYGEYIWNFWTWELNWDDIKKRECHAKSVRKSGDSNDIKAVFNQNISRWSAHLAPYIAFLFDAYETLKVYITGNPKWDLK